MSDPIGRLFLGKRVLVTGGAGFIGSNLVRRLVSEDAEVRVIDNLEPLCGGAAVNLAGLDQQITVVYDDISEIPNHSGLFNDVDFIFNLAGSVSHSDSITQPSRDVRLNYLAHLTFLEECRHRGVSAPIVFASTRQLYGRPAYLPVDENHPIRPVDVNGINKFAAEQLHLLYGHVHGLRTACLRLTNTFGPRQMIRNARQGVFGWFVNRAICGAEIELYGGGNQLRDFTYVDDVVDAFLLAATETAAHGHTFNLAGPKVTLREFAEALTHVTGRGSVRIVEFPPDKKRIDIGDYYGSSTQFESVTGWRPKVDLQLGLRATVKFFEANWDAYK